MNNRFLLVGWMLALAACSPADRMRGTLTGTEMTPAAPKPDFTLDDVNGKRVSFRAATDGFVTLLFFGYTHCPDVCPTHLSNIAASMAKLPPGDRARIRTVFVTTDPARDSAARIRTWLANFDTTFVGLRGSTEDVNRIETTLGLALSTALPGGPTYHVGHAPQVLAFTADDSLRVVYSAGTTRENWTADFPKLLSIRPRR
jgi:protein SCO1/2